MTAGAMRRSLAWLPAWSRCWAPSRRAGAMVRAPGPARRKIPEAALLGGDTTVFDDGDEALVHPLRNLSADYRGPFQIGDGVFNRNWVSAPATPVGRDGLGPTYNATSCSGCHDNNGRGATPQGDEPFLGLLLRLSVGGTNEHGGPQPDPVYGDQLQPYAILGVPAEGTPRVTYAEQPGTYGDGQAYCLRAPTYTVVDLGFGPLADGILISPRLAPQMVGLGLLEAVDEATIEGFAATNGGHTNHVWDVAKQATALGRFGWKANQPTLAQQSFAAFRSDIGITSALFPDKNCGPTQTDCLGAPMSDTIPNIQDPKAEAMVVHALALAVPARRNLDDAQALHGEELFGQIGCGSCHIQKMVTGVLAGLARAVQPDDSPVHGSVAPRHGRGPRRRPTGLRSNRQRVANAAALGPRAVRCHRRLPVPPPRWARARFRRGDPVARRAGRGRARILPHPAEERSRRSSRSSSRRRRAAGGLRLLFFR